MPRSFRLSAGLAVFVALLGVSAARADEEFDPAPYLSAAEAAGMTCSSMGERAWDCVVPVAEPTFGASVSVTAPDDINLSVYRGWPDPRPAEPDVLALMEEFIGLAVGDDPAAIAWLHDMNATRAEEGTLRRSSWRLVWSADQERQDGALADVTLVLAYRPTTATGDPGPAAESWSADGSSTYEGTWTVTSYAVDTEDAGSVDYELGDSVPGTVTVDCIGLDGSCNVTGTFDGELSVAVGAEVVETGSLHQELRYDLPNCGGQVETRTFDVEYGPNSATVVDAFVYDPRTCTEGSTTLFSTDITWTFEGALVEYIPAEPIASGPAPEPGEAEPTDAPVPATPVDPNSGVVEESDREFARSVPAVAEVSTDPAVLLQSAALAALLVFLMPFPSQLFNSTLEEHEDEVRRWLRFDRIGAVAGRIGTFWSSAPGVAAFTVLAALLYGFLDPGFGFDVGSFATFLGMLAGIVLVTAAFAMPLVVAHRRDGERPGLTVVPVSLLVGIACVAISRVTAFQPGYLYGLLIGVAFARELSEAEEGRATAIAAGLMLLVAFGSWLLLGTLPEGEGFGLVVARTALAALMVAGLEGVVFGLLPMRFLPGEPLYAWNRVLWGALLLVGAFAFFHILINPASGYLSDTSRTPLFTVLGLLIGFSVVSVAFWAWFRLRETRQAS